jgi:hypothetical protein
MTLLELLLVMAVLGILMGVGVGMLSSINLGERAAQGLVQNVLRSARNSTLARGAGARIRIDPNAGALRAEAMEVVGTWHFEGGGEALRGAFGIDGVNMGGVVVDDGFVGRALAFGVRSGSKAEVPVHQYSAYDFTDGFRIEFALRREPDGGGKVLSFGQSIGVEITNGGGMRAWFVPTAIDATGREVKAGKVVFPVPAGTIDAQRWTRVAFEYDRRRAVVEIDGVAVVLEDPVLETLPVWPITDALEIGDEQQGFGGAIDALVVSAVAVSEDVALPEGVRFDPGVPAEIRFDAGGNLDRAVHREPLVLTLVYDDERTANVRVGMYGSVE